MAQAWAFLAGREFVTPDDVRAVAGPVLGVRPGPPGGEAEAVVRGVVESVPVPV